MKIALILLMVTQKIEFTSEHKQAQICRHYFDTGYLECSKPMDAKEAHEIVRKLQAKNPKHSLMSWGWHPVIPAKPYNAGCVTLTDMGAGGVKP